MTPASNGGFVPRLRDFDLDACERSAVEHEEEAHKMLAGGRDTTDVAIGCITEARRVRDLITAIRLEFPDGF